MTRGFLLNLLLAPSITGRRASFYAVLAAAVPTFIRASVEGFVSGCELSIFLPFVLLSAVFLGSKHAIATALMSVAFGELVIASSPHAILGSACSIYSLSVFAAGSALLIGCVHGFRRLMELRPRLVGSREGGIIFSLEGGQAWASWYGQSSPVQLGPQNEVAAMMKDFLAQLEVGRRLNQSKD